jgi:hypothetical protein
MERKIIGIFVCMLVIATAVPAVASLNDSGITSMGINSTIQSKQITSPSTVGGNVIFSQRPYLPTESWSFFTSAQNLGPYLCQDDFWDINNVTIDDVHWWGLTLIYNYGWFIGDPNGMTFDIIFYQNTGGAPGTVVPPSPFYHVTPTFTYTGYDFSGFPMYYFEADIPSVFLTDGWLSIQSNTSLNSSSFLWAASPDGNLNALQNGASLGANLAFNLTHKAIPDLDCQGSLSWTGVKPGDSPITGSFNVLNIGQAGSLLDWKIVNWPAWMGSTPFSAEFGYDLPTATPYTVQVSFTAPNQANTQYTGDIKVVNQEDLNDFVIIPVSLKTPLSQGLYHQHFFELFFQRFPHAFPILQQLLGY